MHVLLQTMKMRLSANGLLFEMNSIDCLFFVSLVAMYQIFNPKKMYFRSTIFDDTVVKKIKQFFFHGERDGSQTFTTAAERFLDDSI